MHWYTKCSVERGLTFSQRDNNETLRATEDENDRKRENSVSPLRAGQDREI